MNRCTLSAWSFLIVVVAACVPTVHGQNASGPTDAKHYTFREVHDPNGIGKFYRGRELGFQALYEQVYLILMVC